VRPRRQNVFDAWKEYPVLNARFAELGGK